MTTQVRISISSDVSPDRWTRSTGSIRGVEAESPLVAGSFSGPVAAQWMICSATKFSISVVITSSAPR